MSDAIISQVTQQVADQAAQQHDSLPQGEVDPNVQAQFDQALNGHQEQTVVQQVNTAQIDASQVDGVQQQPVSQVELEAPCSPTLGEAILNGVEKMKTTHDTRSERIEQVLVENEGHEMSVQDCIKIQFEVMQLTLEQDLTGKIADKTSQGVQTLFRNQ